MKYDTYNQICAKTIIVNGPAGSGKTRMVEDIMRFSEDMGYDWFMSAFSRTAAENIDEAVTIHSACSSLLLSMIVATGQSLSFVDENLIYEKCAEMCRFNPDAFDWKGTSGGILKKDFDKTRFMLSIRVWDRLVHEHIGDACVLNDVTLHREPRMERIRDLFNILGRESGASSLTYMKYEQRGGRLKRSKKANHPLTFEQFIHDVVEYETWKHENMFLDYTDIVLNAYAFGLTPDADVIIIDESQDLTYLNARIVWNWSRKSSVKRVYICGDENQALYNFIGGSADYFRNWATSNRPVTCDVIYRYGDNILRDAMTFLKCTGSVYGYENIITAGQEDEVITAHGRNGLRQVLETYSKKERGNATILALTNYQVNDVDKYLKQHGVECGDSMTFHASKGRTVPNSIPIDDIPASWVKRSRRDIASLASLGYVGHTRAQSTQIKVSGFFTGTDRYGGRGYHNLERICRSAA
ncbi:AAA family ATPase [Methanococcoides methylutens]|uniref:Uncharacterized protein n=1 Tax=Methanococcoides methylutens MM1 TaxID=1434104 RepID=A0A0E3ST91_METMT|nr:AAA family ATPase [Methanococcoides methylutens]AKB85988.1 hypothetical protein MCMEM_1935 [Methanococcoides methylutens MM1]